MKLILCLDDRNGLAFNNRRQSRDREVIKRIVRVSKGCRLFIEPYSEILFRSEGSGNVLISENMAEEAEEEDFCFMEREMKKALLDKAGVLILYRWNRRYPGDVFFDFDEDMWEKVSEEDFPGFSHEKITEAVYRRRR